ncbi:uncharacterized protein B0I36DRAFT_354863 [Microdochium trichocladiopsis]|uniref:FAD-binding domain-containing protein n=1 Tax=Microdochium trichocladiopsis TaxID=1682393 RepID=A0A9P9BJY1_9PEZI|nr:uncharacterized protein B0I36DRAFT_354863 [Microdochium trichocladiopsis]KAH7018603.1 hypothetical protein B0I36DRAFT_354863 [Microdochium trichocladiopsis]
MKLTIVMAVTTLAWASTAAPTTSDQTFTPSVEDLFRSLQRGPESLAELRPNGTVVSYDQHGNILDHRVASEAAVREYNDKIAIIQDVFRQGFEDPEVQAGRVDDSPASNVYERVDGELFTHRLDCNSYPCDDNDDCWQVGCKNHIEISCSKRGLVRTFFFFPGSVDTPIRTPAQMAPLKIIIIGGGLAGACLGNGLVNHSSGLINVTVYERDAEGDERGGYQIRLGAYALAGLRACLTTQQFKDLLPYFGRSGGVVSSAPCIFNPSDLKVMVDLSKAPTYEKSAPIARMRLREYLQEPLRKHDAIRYGKKFLRYESLEGDDTGHSKVRVHFADGTQEDCDILISAEGSGSRINKQIGLNNIIDTVTKDFGSLLGKCHLSWPVLQTLPKQLLEKGTIYTANSKAIVFAAAYLPPSLSSFSHQGSNADPTKPENYDEEQASLFLGVGWTTGPPNADLPHIKDKKGLMRQKLTDAGFHPSFLNLVDAVDDDNLITTPTRSAKTDTPVNWRQKILADAAKVVDRDLANPRVWLMGDSIHAMLPSRGMGANNAIRDTADVLGPLLELGKQHKSRSNVTDEQVSTQLAIFENTMLPRAMAWVKKSKDQELPDLESTKGKIIIAVLRVGIFFLSGAVKILKLFGWTPKDDAPELA